MIVGPTHFRAFRKKPTITAALHSHLYSSDLRASLIHVNMVNKRFLYWFTSAFNFMSTKPRFIAKRASATGRYEQIKLAEGFVRRRATVRAAGRLLVFKAAFFYEFCLNDRVPADHLLRKIDAVLNSSL